MTSSSILVGRDQSAAAISNAIALSTNREQVPYLRPMKIGVPIIIERCELGAAAEHIVHVLNLLPSREELVLAFGMRGTFATDEGVELIKAAQADEFERRRRDLTRQNRQFGGADPSPAIRRTRGAVGSKAAAAVNAAVSSVIVKSRRWSGSLPQ